MKGVILAGGKGTRLYPLTKGISKQLLPVYKYPMIYYPINTLKSFGIREILIITTEEQNLLFKETLKDVRSVNLTFEIQKEPKGIAEALLIAENWLNGSDVVLVLGDNIIINADQNLLKNTPNSIYTYKVKNPERYGVVVKDFWTGGIREIVEKPKEFLSNEAVIGLYVLSNKSCQYAKNLKPSKRGELEIVDLIKDMNANEPFKVIPLDGFWFDAGTHDDLLDCSNLVKAIETRTDKSFDLA